MLISIKIYNISVYTVQLVIQANRMQTILEKIVSDGLETRCCALHTGKFGDFSEYGLIRRLTVSHPSPG